LCPHTPLQVRTLTMTQVNFADLPNNTNPSWWKDPGMRRSMVHIFILYTAVYSLGYDGSLLNGLQGLPAYVPSFDLGLLDTRS
jgi:hypothetical protein